MTHAESIALVDELIREHWTPDGWDMHPRPSLATLIVGSLMDAWGMCEIRPELNEAS